MKLPAQGADDAASDQHGKNQKEDDNRQDDQRMDGHENRSADCDDIFHQAEGNIRKGLRRSVGGEPRRGLRAVGSEPGSEGIGRGMPRSVPPMTPSTVLGMKKGALL